MTQIGHRTSERSFGESPVIMVYQKPEAFNQTNGSWQCFKIYINFNNYIEKEVVLNTLTSKEMLQNQKYSTSEELGWLDS